MHIYIKGRLGGKVANKLEPYLREEHPNRLTTLQTLLNHLYTQYHNPEAAEKALEAFDSLNYVRNTDFYVFKNNFIRLAGKYLLPKAQ